METCPEARIAASALYREENLSTKEVEPDRVKSCAHQDPRLPKDPQALERKYVSGAVTVGAVGVELPPELAFEEVLDVVVLVGVGVGFGSVFEQLPTAIDSVSMKILVVERMNCVSWYSTMIGIARILVNTAKGVYAPVQFC